MNAQSDLGETAIFSAIIHMNVRCIRLLVDYRCNINAVWQMSTPLYLLLLNRDVETSKMLIMKGAQISHLQGMVQVYR